MTSSSCFRGQPLEIELKENWTFRKAGDSIWQEAEVPGCIHLDLLNNQIVENPFFGENEKDLQWIEKKDWEYSTFFFVDKEILDFDHTELNFQGLDTYADIYLNDDLILQADNMFRQWFIDCKDKLKRGKNELSIKFRSPIIMDSVKASTLPYKLPDSRGFTRKAPYQYGWDWGPRFVTSGIWRPVYLNCWNDFKLENVQVIQSELNDNIAKLTAIYEIVASGETAIQIIVKDKSSDLELGKIDERLQPGKNKITIDFSIDKPELWWCNGLGEPYLYDLDFIVRSKRHTDEINHKIGIRTLKLVQTPDSIGKSFHFELNDIPVFMKGANYIPQDNFPSRVTQDKYRQTIQAAVDANMNMLRVWGGGIYESDIFYDLCDENGILVWQDFMFACNMYPGDSAFLENVKQEATQNVKRLRNHPCIALWCGNNEVSEGWHNWGWQTALGYSFEDSLKILNTYLKIFEDILPGVISDYDPQRSYWPSSPSTGWGHKEALYDGDMHYWGVWWGEEPFDIYEKKIGRFMSEYGFQGFPDYRTWDSCLLPEDKNLQSASLLNHQKHPRGMELIQMYMERDFPVPANFKDYNYVSQLVQAFGIKTALEAHRRAMPYCMGTLYWQLNDCWPVVSWSSLDYYNHWKALHYYVKEAYKDILISFEEKNDKIQVFVVSDLRSDLSATLGIKIIDFEGNKKIDKNKEIQINKLSSEIFHTIETAGITKKDHLLIASLKIADSLIARNLYYFLPPKLLELPFTSISSEIFDVEKGYQIRLSTDKLAKNVFVSTNVSGHFSANFFDLLPRETRIITFESNTRSEDFKNDLKIIALNDINLNK
jgi:beta-mannosidase